MNGLLRRIFDYIRAIAWVVVPFCMIASLHYLFVFFPRSVKENDNHIYFNSLGLDYWGVIVGFFTLIVTLLVGWQIFSTIRERERNERLVDDIRQFQNSINAVQRGLEERLHSLEQCCSDGKNNIKDIYDTLKVHIDRIEQVEDLPYYLQTFEQANKLEDNGLTKEALFAYIRIASRLLSYSVTMQAIGKIATLLNQYKNSVRTEDVEAKLMELQTTFGSEKAKSMYLYKYITSDLEDIELFITQSGQFSPTSSPTAGAARKEA